MNEWRSGGKGDFPREALASRAGMETALGDLLRGCTCGRFKLLFNKVIKRLKSEVALLSQRQFDHKKLSPSQLEKNGKEAWVC